MTGILCVVKNYFNSPLFYNIFIASMSFVEKYDKIK